MILTFVRTTALNHFRHTGEKRKRKLQYLQQLLRDGESPEQAAQTVEEQERMVTPEYHTQTQQPPAFVVPSNSNFQSFAATSSNAIEPIFPSSSSSYDRQFGRTPPNYDTYDNSWSTQMYHSSPNVNISAWTVPSWMPNVDYATTASSRSDEFQYTPPSHTHHNFEQVPTPPQPSRTPDPDLFLLGTYGHCRRADSQQPMSVRNMSLPSSTSSSPYHYTKYAGVP